MSSAQAWYLYRAKVFYFQLVITAHREKCDWIIEFGTHHMCLPASDMLNLIKDFVNMSFSLNVFWHEDITVHCFYFDKLVFKQSRRLESNTHVCWKLKNKLPQWGQKYWHNWLFTVKDFLFCVNQAITEIFPRYFFVFFDELLFLFLS